MGGPETRDGAEVPVTGDDPRIGQRIDRYVIDALLGRGGFGSVYRARHHVLGRPVALKILHARAAEDASVVERFLREAKAASAIGSAHIVDVYDAGVADGEVFLAMELLEGEDLAARIARAAPMPDGDAMTIGLAILDALSAAHAAGIVHRDLKPANVFLARVADGVERVKLLDFGLSTIAGPRRAQGLTRAGEVLGTPHYVAPEQLRSAAEADPRADLWSWGAIMFEMLSGARPYEARTFEELVVTRMGAPPRSIDEVAPRASASLRRLIADTLALARGDRPPSADVIARGLRAFPATLAAGRALRAPATRVESGPRSAPAPNAPTRRSALRWLPALLAFAIPVVLASLCLLSIALLLALERLW